MASQRKTVFLDLGESGESYDFLPYGTACSISQVLCNDSSLMTLRHSVLNIEMLTVLRYFVNKEKVEKVTTFYHIESLVPRDTTYATTPHS